MYRIHPRPDNSQDIVISNCVINLSVDKDSVFQEIYRVLKPGGRFVIADVFSHEPVPMYIKYDEELYGKCLGGAMDMHSGLALIRRAGFQGVHLVSTSSYSTVDTTHFLSLTLIGYKTDLQCQTGAKYATLLGPFSRVQDELSNTYVRGVPIELSEEQHALLQLPPYKNYFSFGDTLQSFSTNESYLSIKPDEQVCVYVGNYSYRQFS